MKGYRFQQIVDSRFHKGCLKEGIIAIYEKQKKLLEEIGEKYGRENFRMSIGLPRKLEWNDGTTQYRFDCEIRKNTRAITWNNIFGMVNNIKVCAYDRVN